MIAPIAILLLCIGLSAAAAVPPPPPPQTQVGARIDRFQQKHPVAAITSPALAKQFIHDIRALGSPIVSDLNDQTRRTTFAHFLALQKAAFSSGDKVAAVDKTLAVLFVESEELQASLAKQAGEYQDLNQYGAAQFQVNTGSTGITSQIVDATNAEATGDVVNEYRGKINAAVLKFRTALVQLQEKPGSEWVLKIVARLGADFKKAFGELVAARKALYRQTNAKVADLLA